jgi:hypothetical protein
MIGRREFITLLGGVATSPILWPLSTTAQQPGAVRRIGVFMNLASDNPDAP